MNRISLRAAVRLSGLSEHTIRAWERRYQAISPVRSNGGRRMYSQEEIDRLRVLANLVNLGHSISTIARQSTQALEALLRKSQPEAGLAPGSVAHSTKSSAMYVEKLMEAIRKMDSTRIEQLLRRTKFEFSARDFVMRIILPVLGRVGDEVSCEDLSVAHEHTLSSTLRNHLGELYAALRGTIISASAPRVALCTPEGDLHEFGTLLCAILCTLHGFNTTYLGPNLPAKDITKAARGLNCSIVVIGTTAVPQPLRKEALRDYLLKLDSGLPPSMELWVGGTGLNEIPGLRLHRPMARIQDFAALERILHARVS